eukprot:366000-Chlamydomonas_euryale.AAC.19
MRLRHMHDFDQRFLAVRVHACVVCSYVTYALCGAIECGFRGSPARCGKLRDYALVSMLAMMGAYLTNWALNYLNYTTRIVFKVWKRYIAGNH